ncbi:SGNH hydrolase [Xylona heveae TC161]|uniref:SGNH hydrolase n=1 Tax=Xylona heveae (strain CBS 132557 / TC161) TaxID=1328760 RepID=A0A165FLW6_XYLHT|nr:SGNH hydrolase [Xylona heveae TC161]KZF21133.1 SGNH hydrolase [Xylona heveae TC161]
MDGFRWLYNLAKALIAFHLFVSPATAAPQIHTSTYPRQLQGQDNDTNFEVLPFIKTFAAVGDSYSVGIGAGKRLEGLGDWYCSRYDHSYPYLINGDGRLGNDKDREFKFLSCSGATIPDITETQLGALEDGSQQVITISGGGNDAGFAHVLNGCIYQWTYGTQKTCDKNIQQASDTLNSAQFSESIDNLISLAKKKLSPDGHIYYTGYQQFFATDDRQCDKVSWSWLLGPDKEYLTLENRQKLNSLVNLTNSKIEAAVNRAADSVDFVSVDKSYGEAHGRFCEAEYPEPEPDRPGLLLYESDTEDPKSKYARFANILQPEATGSDLVMADTFEGQIEALYQSYLAQQPNATSHPKIGLPPGSLINMTTNIKFSLPSNLATTVTVSRKSASHSNDTIAKNVTQPTNSADFVEILQHFNATTDQKNRLYLSAFLPDCLKRIFHPRPRGHQMMADAVIYHMTVRNANKLKEPVSTENVPVRT